MFTHYPQIINFFLQVYIYYIDWTKVIVII